MWADTASSLHAECIENPLTHVFLDSQSRHLSRTMLAYKITTKWSTLRVALSQVSDSCLVRPTHPLAPFVLFHLHFACNLGHKLLRVFCTPAFLPKHNSSFKKTCITITQPNLNYLNFCVPPPKLKVLP